MLRRTARRPLRRRGVRLPVLQYHAAGDGAGTVQLAGPIFQAEDYGLAFAPNSDLRPPVDDALLEIRRDGTYDLIKRKWFSVEESHSRRRAS